MDMVSTVGRMLLSLAFVLVVMWLIARKVRRPFTGGKNTKVVDVLGRQQLSKGSSVAVVRVMDQALIIGVSDTQVNVLGTTDLDAVQAMVTEGNEARALRRKSSLWAARTGDGTADSGVETASTAGPATVSPLAGSALSLDTWKQAFGAVRSKTQRPMTTTVRQEQT